MTRSSLVATVTIGEDARIKYHPNIQPAEGGSYLIHDHRSGVAVWISLRDWDALRAKIVETPRKGEDIG